MAQTVYVRMPRSQALGLLRGLPGVLSGRIPGGEQLARGLLQRLGVTALSLAKVRFETLSRGGVYTPTGEQWPPLAPETIARCRRPKGVPTRHQARKAVIEAARRLQTTRKGTKSRDKALRAYERAKRKAALAYAPVQILVDTGLLRNSLSPATDGPSNDPNQVFTLEPGAVAVGTRLKYAGYHQTGTRHMPARPPLPVTWPEAWNNPLQTAWQTGLVRVIEELLTRQ